MSAPPSQPSQSQPSATTFNERLNEQLINCLNIQTNVIQNLAQYSQHISLQLFEIKNTVEILSNRVLTLQQQQSHYGPAPPPAAHLPSPYYPNYPHPPPPPSTLPPSFTSSFMGHPPPPMPFGIPPQAYAEPRGPASMSNISHGNLPAVSHPAVSVPPTSLSNPAPFSFATTTASSTITTASASAEPIPSISSKPIVSAPASVPPSTTVATTSTSSASTSSQSIFSNLLKQNPTDNNGHKTTPFFPPPPAGSNQTNGSPFNFGFNAPGSNIFGVGLANSSVSNSSASKVEAHAADDDDEAGGEDNSYEPNVSFKPIVQLSAVEVKTGEEDENVLFCERAKLYRFDRDSNQMKERGIGEMKILQHKTTQICRVLMRREQVLKLCANHQISAQMDLKPHGGSANTYVWSAMDFADGEAKHETLCVRFKTDEQAKRFAKVFNEAKEVNSKKSSEESSASNTEKKEKETGSDDEVVPLGEVQPSAEQIDRAKKLQLPSTFYLYENKEPCKGCPGCEDDSSSNENQPANKAQNETKATVPPAASKTPLSSSENIKFSFTANAEKAQPTLQKQSSTTKDEEKAAPASSSTPDTSSTGTPYDNKPSIFGSLSGNASQSIFGGSPAMNGGIASLFGSNPLKPAGTGTSGFSFPGFGSPTTTSATSTTATTTTTTSTSSTGTFSFAAAVSNANNSTPSGSPFSFGLQGSSAGSKPLFGNASGFSFADLAKQSAASPANDQATNGNEQRVFAGQGSLVFGTSALNVTSTGNNHEDEEGEGGGDDDSYEPSISFKPVVQLAAVEVKTGEEDEEILFCERAKLYRFDREANQMKERGIGEMKILQHKTTHQYRIVMRREQVLKLCANHQITSQMELKPHGGSENTYVWSAMDYADGEAKHETLCIRFKTADQAKRFVKLFNEAKEAHAKAHD